jgi:hypothetical protein
MSKKKEETSLVVRSSEITSVSSPWNQDIAEAAKSLQVRSQASLQVGVELKNSIKSIMKQIHEAFDPIVESANKLHKLATKTRKDQLQAPEEALSLVESKILRYAEEERRKTEEAERKRLEELHKAEEKGQVKKIETILATPQREDKSKVEGVQYRELWALEIIDPSAIPREYLIPDEKRLSEMARSLKNDFNIPGCKATSRRIVI